MNVSTELLVRLQAKQERIRNMCIMAHVDHGKTTLSDHLIGSNGLIHPKLMGELRYLDSREDEQERGITIKSSSISLLYVPGAANRPEGPRSVSESEKLSEGYLINLIDSPGHVDFCSEVSTAARLSDGALVVVDAVEGVCIQTHAVLRQAWEEKVTPCLFINKIDRLITELRMTPQEAYQRFQSIVTHVNMIMSAFHSEKYMSEADAVLAVETEREAAAAAAAATQTDSEVSSAPPEEDSEADVFQPVRCNVAFGSGYDGWAFRLDQFANMYAEKLACKPAALQKALWGDYSFSAKDKRVVRMKGGGAGDGKTKNMFVQFILDAIWKAVMRAWLPLSEAVLGMATQHMPSPAQAAPTRIPRLLRAEPGVLPESLAASMPNDAQLALRRAEGALACSSAAQDVPTVIYVSKMIAVPYSALPRQPGEPTLMGPKDDVFLAFGRVYSGVAREGQRVHVLSSGYSPAQPESIHRQTATLTRLYLMMGRALERLKSVPAGCVLAIAGLDSCILKSATVSTSPATRPLAPMTFQAAPIVRVAVEPALPAEMPKLVEGLRLLNRADPFVEISVLESGEHVLGAAGEVHLDTCVRDLRERFARINLQVSPPLVAFRETVACAEEAPAPTTAPTTAPATGAAARRSTVVESTTPNTLLTVRVRASPIPGAIASALEEHTDTVKRLISTATSSTHAAATHGAGLSQPSTSQPAAPTLASASPHRPASPPLQSATQQQGGDGRNDTGGAGGGNVSGSEAFLSQMAAAVSCAPVRFVSLAQQVWQLGPKGTGPNFLLAPPEATGARAPGQAGAGTALFDVPPTQVVKATRQAQGLVIPSHAAAIAAQVPQQPAQGDAEGADAAAPAAARVLIALPRIGRASLAAPLGLATSHTAGPDASAPSQPAQEATHTADTDTHNTARADNFIATIQSGLNAGFQLATGAGPLCEEPMWGVLFEVDVRLSVPDTLSGQLPSNGHQPLQGSLLEGLLDQLDLQEDVYGPFSGQVMTTMAAACRRAVSEAEPRLAEAHYLCAVQASAEALSGVYAVLGKRRSRILREEMREGSDTFLVHAYLPVEAAFGLADDMRRRSSGAAAASLLLSHWERLHVDPFFVPTTEEEREEHGEEGVSSNASNVARRLIDAVRRRKGLAVEEKVVKVATKQRTLKRNV